MADRFHVTYLLTLTADEDPEERIRALQLEQSAELPDHVVQSLGMQHVAGAVTTIHSLEAPLGELQNGLQQLEVTIAWPVNNHGNEITQLLNVLFGNISMKTGIAITDICWEDLSEGMTTTGSDIASGSDVISGRHSAPDSSINSGAEPTVGGTGGLFSGPAFGIERIREKWGIHGRALACTALKPMGLSSRKLADLAYRFALGGVDIIKDDHGLADQQTAPFAKRVEMCVEAMDRAAQKTGRRSRYFPNITTDPHRVIERYKQAARLGADGVLLCPMLVGPALMHHLARLDIWLPIMAHPSFSGPYIAKGIVYGSIGSAQGSPVTDGSDKQTRTSSGDPAGAPSTRGTEMDTMPHGFEPGLFYGGLMRALGADFTIYPNTGGRFSFSRETCDSINDHARRNDLPFARCFPTPGGGMQRDRMAHWLDAYGPDTTFLMGGSLFEDPAGIEEASRAFMETLGA
jgi:ribulose-bisphosphate carboxylase large chain